MKKIFLSLVIILVILIGAAIALPFIFKDKIIAKVKSEINNNINATVDFGEFDLSIIKHFPKLTFTIENVKVIGKNEFALDTLANIKKLDLALDIMSVINGSNYTIHSIYLNEPKIHAKVLSNGKANWDITKPSDATTPESAESKPFSMKLQKYGIENGQIVYDDQQSKMYAKLVNLNHTGAGDFTSDLFNLVTETKIDQLTFNYGGIAYLNKVNTALDAVLEIDNAKSKYTFKENKLMLNALQLAFNGFVAMPANDIDMDITFKTNSNSFKDLFSLIPGAFTKDFADVKTAGNIVFNGFVKGKYNDRSMPAFNINVQANQAMVQYPGLPKAIQNISLDCNAACANGVIDQTVVNIKKCHFEMGTAPFDFSLLLKQPTTAMNIDLVAKGKLNLNEVNTMFPMEGVTKLTGLLDMDITAKGSVAQIQKENYDNLDANGKLILQNVEYASKDFTKPMLLRNLNLLFTPKNVKLEKLDAKVSNMNVVANGYLDNVIGYVLTNQTLGGNIDVAIDNLDVNEWMTPSTATTDASKISTEKSEVFKVPNNLDFTMKSAIQKLHYDNIDMSNVNGLVSIKDEKMTLDHLKANLLDGTMDITGSYATKNVALPDINLVYEIKDMDIQKSFKTFNTVKKIAPIAEYMKGQFTTTLSMNGKMQADMMPELQSINGEGFITIFKGVLSNFKPIQKIADVLQLTQYKEMAVPDFKTWFKIHNGRINVEPFNVKSADMAMNIGGSQGLDQTIDYTIKMDMPRAKLGKEANAMIDKALGLANAKAGTNVALSDRIKFDVFLGGTITNPTVKTGLKDAAKNKADELKDLAKAELEKKKQEAIDKAKAEADKLKAEAEKKAREEADKAKQQALDAANKSKAEIEAKAKAEADRLKKEAADKAKAEADKAKQKAKDALNGLFKK